MLSLLPKTRAVMVDGAVSVALHTNGLRDGWLMAGIHSDASLSTLQSICDDAKKRGLKEATVVEFNFEFTRRKSIVVLFTMRMLSSGRCVYFWSIHR